MKRFLKIFLIAVSSMMGVVGVSLGIMYLTGYFTVDPVLPEEIEFQQTSYEVDDDFEMMITSKTEGVNQLRLELFFDGVESSGDVITDEKIIVPRFVEIGKPFTVEIKKEMQQFNGQNVIWPVGGVSQLKAKSLDNIHARETEVKVYIDVPVYDIVVQTSSNSDFANTTDTFNIDSTFFAKAQFIPEQSKYLYSKDGTDGDAEYKDVFFPPKANTIQQVDVEGLDRYVRKYKALERAENVEITAQAFVKASTQIQAYKDVENFNEDIAYNNLLNILQNKVETQQAKEKTAKVNFSQLEVGGFNADTTGVIPATFNKYTNIFINKQDVVANGYNLNAKVVASDNVTELPGEVLNFALAVMLDGGAGYSQALINQVNADVALEYSSKKTVLLFGGKQVDVYFPVENTIDISHSSWSIAPLKEDINIRLALVLFDKEGNVVDSSFAQVGSDVPKYIFEMDKAKVVSGQVYWTNPLTENKILYIYDGKTESDRQVEEYDVKQNHSIFIPSNNTYQEVKYFAYYEDNEGKINNEFALDSFVVTVGNPFVATISSGVDAKLFEIPNGVIRPKYNSANDFEGKIKVLFAVVKTDYKNVPVTVGDVYVVDKFGSNSAIGTPQTMTFEIQRTLSQIEASVLFKNDEAGVEYVHYDELNDIFAVKINTSNAFVLKFDVTDQHEHIFVRDYNKGDISVDFFVNGNLNNNLFNFVKPEFVENEETGEVNEFTISYSVGEFDYIENDMGYREIRIRITYRRGNNNDVVSDVVLFNKQVEDQTVTTNNLFHVYDGKISELYFTNIQADPENPDAPSLSEMSENNPIVVTTNLEKAQDNGGNVVIDSNNVYLASQGSTYSVKLDSEDVSNLIFDGANANTIFVSAYDKYHTSILDNTNWELVSSDPEVIVVDNISKTISFVGSSDNIVTVSLRTTANGGQGNKVYTALKSLYFKVQTQGQIVKVESNVDKEPNVIFDNLNETSFVAGENVYTLKDNGSSFTENSLEIEILGKTANEYKLKDNANNFTNNMLVNLYYGLRKGNSDYFTIYNLKNILTWTRADDSNLDGFIEFVKDEEEIVGFSIINNFGQTGYLNFNVTSEIGVNLLVKIVINPSISTSVTGTYDHKNLGASDTVLNGVTYVGVFAQQQIKINLLINILTDSVTFKTVIYDENGESVFEGPANTFINQQQLEIQLTYNDVIEKSAKYFEVVFVSDTVNGIRRTYDYSKLFYFYVNPNIKSQRDKVSENIYVSSSTVIDAIINDEENQAIKVERICGTEPISFDSAAAPYVYAKITNSMGEEISTRYFVIEGNSLKIRPGELLQGSNEVYISVFFGNGDTENDMVIDTYKYVVTPELKQIADLGDLSQKMGFVTYDGQTYLQLLGDNEFKFSEIEDCFAVGENSAGELIKASFADIYTNQNIYWQITTDSIQVNYVNQIYTDKLIVTLTIQDIGIVELPVIITPKLWPLVNYDEANGSPNNYLANNDLYVNQTISELVKNDIYDVVTDGQEIDVFGTTGLNKLDDEVYVYSLLDGNGEIYLDTFARIDNQGKLKIDNVGQDTYLIVVASIGNFKIYYRLKIQSSLKLEAYYPYIKNLDELEQFATNRAEYVLFKTTDISKVIDLTSEFDPVIPATKESVSVNSEQQNITGRFQLFKYDLFGLRNQKLSTDDISVNISSIKRGTFGGNTTEIDSQLWNDFAVITKQESASLIEIFNNGNFIIELEVVSKENASVIYTIVVEQSIKSYTLVDSNNGTDITNYEQLSQDAYEIVSPENIEGEVSKVNIGNVKLKLTTGSLVSDKTDELGYTIVDESGLISFDKENKEIVVEYSANNIKAQIIFWNKYGEIARRDILLVSNTFVAEKATTDKIDKLTIQSGQVVNLNDLIDIVQGTEKFDGTVTYVNFEFDKQVNYLINNFDKQGSAQPEFVILPLQPYEQDTLLLDVTVELEPADPTGETTDFMFTLVINVESGFEEMNPNSSNAYIGESVVASDVKEINIFESVFALTGQGNRPNLTFDSTSGAITGALGTVANYTLNYDMLSGGNFVEITDYTDGVLLLTTKPVASDAVILIKFTLNLEYGEHLFNIISYYQFVINPGTQIEVNYPCPNGQQQSVEKIHKTDEFNLSEASIFAQLNKEDERKQRIVVTGDASKLKVKVSGDTEVITNTASEYYPLNADFNFANISLVGPYASLTFTVVIVDGDYVVELASYSLEVYEEYSSLYSVTVETLNDVEDNHEIFFIGEGRLDIFNGPQALIMNITSNVNLLTGGVSIEYFKDTTLIGQFVLNSTDAGSKKTVIIDEWDKSKDLSYDNIRFKVNGNDTYLTLNEMSEHDTAYFTKDSAGNVNFELFKRTKIKYLGIDVTSYEEMQARIKIIETNVENANEIALDNFNVEYVGLGLQGEEPDIVCNNQIDRSFNILYLNGENIVGSYKYRVKNNVQIQNNNPIEITAGEQVSKLFEALGVVNSSGDYLVKYQTNTITKENLPQIMQDNILRFDLKFNEFNDDGNVYRYKYLDTKERYSISNECLTFAGKLVDIGEEITPTPADYQIWAYGAPNNGLYCELKLSWNYVIDEETYSFEHIIPVHILPNVNIILKNLDGTENSASNPQVVTPSKYDANGNYNHILVNKNDLENSLVYAYYTNGSQDNFAFDLSYIPNSSDLQILPDAVSKILVIPKPSFAIQNYEVQIKDQYGYEVNYFVQAQPQSTISFVSMTNVNEFFEGETFAIVTDVTEYENADHVISLSKANNFDDVKVTYLIKTTDDEVLQSINNQDLSVIQKINFLDSVKYSQTTNSLGVYIEIILTKDSEQYIIKTDSFSLQQRYVYSIIDNNVRDNYEFDLTDKITFTDRKLGLNIGEPTLTDDITLVLNDENLVSVNLVGKLIGTSAVIEQNQYEIVDGKNYYLMSEVFADQLNSSKTVVDYNYFVNGLAFVDSVATIEKSITLFADSIRITYTDIASGQNIISDDCYDVLLFDGVQYHFVPSVKADNQQHSIYSSNGYVINPAVNDYWSIVGYKQASAGATFNIKKELSGIEHQTWLYVENAQPFNITLENIGQTEEVSVSQSSLNIVYNETDVKVNGNNVSFELDGTTLKVLLSDITANSNQNETWVLSDFDYDAYNSIKSKLTLKQDKRLDVVTVINQIPESEEYETVTINFNGEEKLVVMLNKDGNQTYSMLQQGINIFNLELAQNPISSSDMENIKGINVANDGITFNVPGAEMSGSLKVKISQTRNSTVIAEQIFVIEVKTYMYNYVFGISENLGGFVCENDLFTIEFVSWPSSLKGQTLKVYAPYQFETMSYEKEIVLPQTGECEKLAFTVVGDNSLQNNKETIKIASSGLYENTGSSTKCVSAQQYYVIEYRGAKYKVNMNFNVTPYYYSINLDNAKGKITDSSVWVYDYTQTKDADDNIIYEIEQSSWANGIVFEDIHGNIINDQLATQTNMKFVFETQYGSAKFVDGYDIQTTNIEDITQNHITMEVLVALNNDISTDEWLSIGTLTLRFNTNFVQSIPAGISMIINNTSSSEDGSATENTFRFANYDSGSDISFNAITLFEDKTLDVSDIQIMNISDNTNGHYYLSDEKDTTYKLIYEANAGVDVATDVVSQGLESNFAFVYGLKTGKSVIIEASNGTDTIVGTYNNNSDEIIYNKIPFTAFTWKNKTTDSPTSYTAEFDEFVYDTLNCFVPTSYVDVKSVLDNLDIYAHYGYGERSDYINNEKLIANDNFHYSNTFRLVKNADNKITLNISPGVKYYAVTEVVNNDYESYTSVYEFKNTTGLASNMNVDLKTANPTVVILTDITNEEGTGYDFVEVQSLFKNSGIYTLQFGNGSYDNENALNSSISIIKNVGAGLSAYGFKPYLYDQTENVNLGINENSFIKITNQTSLITGKTYTLIANENDETYTYQIVDNRTFVSEDFENNQVYTAITTSKNADDTYTLAWHEYKDAPLPNGKLFYRLNDQTLCDYSSNNNINVNLGDKVTQIWDGMYSFNYNTSETYILKTGDSDKGTVFKPTDTYVTNEKVNVCKVLDLYQQIPLKQDITISVYNPVVVWAELHQNGVLTLDNYYTIKENSINKAMIYFVEDYSKNILQILGNVDVLNINNLTFEQVDANNYQINGLDANARYLVTNELSWQQVVTTDDSGSAYVDLKDLFKNGYINTNLTCRKLVDYLTINPDDLLGGTVTGATIEISYNGGAPIINNLDVTSLVLSGNYFCEIYDVTVSGQVEGVVATISTEISIYEIGSGKINIELFG